ncbi:GPI-anchored CFEM domain protein B [Penicillium hispanicum]|uniref:GPI-anchored CFEM domain protein B n=1 Tax=Penicillium hispanicum TaxID=1080232 RepID=UPI002540B719|nr:GPI-anchored CFEM domain protein B [Penicillium hispanicum]KAJ5584899.1 GPI-anchored CFEM domain protein B [Penicillium hispanicum]
MHFSPVLTALVAAGLANAQIPNVPICSLNCFVSALSSDGCSSLIDFACHCQKPQLVSDITPCVKKACAVSDQASVSNVVVSQCSSAGYPISVPHVETNTVSGSLSFATETAAPTTGSSKSSAESSASATGPRSGSAPATATSPVLTRSTSASSSSRATSGTTTTGTSTPQTSKPGSSSHSASSSAYTGAAANMKGNMASFAAIVAVAANVL